MSGESIEPRHVNPIPAEAAILHFFPISPHDGLKPEEGTRSGQEGGGGWTPAADSVIMPFASRRAGVTPVADQNCNSIAGERLYRESSHRLPRARETSAARGTRSALFRDLQRNRGNAPR